jgi:XTP/dITP diphosphohydrolase
VFAGAQVDGLDDIVANWERIKKAEKARSSPLDGIALAQPALSLAAKVVGRLAKADAPPLPAGDGLGARLLRLVAEARERGEDPEAALRATVLAYMAEARTIESRDG